MFQRLRSRFLFLLLFVVSLLMLLFFSVIFISSYMQMTIHADALLDRYVGNSIITFYGDMQSNAVAIPISQNNEIIGEANREYGNLRYKGMYFRYKRNSIGIAFVDISKEWNFLSNMFGNFLKICIPVLTLIYFISRYFADKAIQPIEEAYKKQEEFISNASHEIKTPLATISTNVSVISSCALPEQQKWLGYIKREVERIDKLTGSLLYLARVGDADSKDKLPVNISKIVEDDLLPLEAVFFESNIVCEKEIQEGLIVNANAGQLRRLFSILIENAVKYTDGKIKVILRSCKKCVYLEVFNTGIGISKEDLPFIFDRFYRTDKARKFSGGFGIGLSIAKAIAEEYGGNIRAESIEGQWAKFIVTLPV